MADTNHDDLPRVREGGGRRALIAGLIAFFMLESGLHMLMGNYGHADVLRAAPGDACVELEPGAETHYSGWLQKIARSRIRVNRHGARGAAIDASPRPGVLRIASLGDSFAFGQGVNEEDSYAQVLSASLKRHGIANEVLNFAVPGHGPSHAIATLQARVLPLKPDLVLFNVSPDDLAPRAQGCAQPPIAGAWRSFLRTMYLPRALWLGWTRLARPHLGTGSTEPPAAHFRANVDELVRLSAAGGTLASVVLLTDREAFDDPSFCRGCPPAHDQLEDGAVPVVDLGPVWKRLRAEPKSFFLAGEGHLSVEGNLLVGLQLADALAAWPVLRDRARERAALLSDLP